MRYLAILTVVLLLALSGCARPRLNADLPPLPSGNKSPWAAAQLFETEHYQIITNSQVHTAQQMGVLLENLYTTCEKLFGPGQADGRLRVYAFSSREQYIRKTAALEIPATYLSGLYTPGAAAGIYLPLVTTKQTHPFFTLVHEGTHQYLHEVHGLPIHGASVRLPSQPLWLSEGLALYLEAALVGTDRLTPGTLHPEQLNHLQRLLRQDRTLNLRQVVETTYGEPFSDDDYAVAWGLVQYIQEKGLWPAFRAGWREAVKSKSDEFLGQDLQGNEPNLLQRQQQWAQKLSRLSSRVFEQQLLNPGHDWASWEKDWEKYILRLTSGQ